MSGNADGTRLWKSPIPFDNEAGSIDPYRPVEYETRNVGDIRRADTALEAIRIIVGYIDAGFVATADKLGDGYLITVTGRADE